MEPMERLEKMNTKENLWIYILILLKKSKLYAWKIPDLIEKNFNFKPGKITPYRVLYSLERAGLVKSYHEERKRIYEITEKGMEELEKAKKFYQKLIELIEK
jgi:DNA-binding PadR family transcriptional regulator